MFKTAQTIKKSKTLPNVGINLSTNGGFLPNSTFLQDFSGCRRIKPYYSEKTENEPIAANKFLSFVGQTKNKEEIMLRKMLAFLFLVLFLCHPMHEALAQELELGWVGVWREYRVYEPGDFTGVTDVDMMTASAEVSGIIDPAVPGDYEVHLTSGASGPVDTFLYGYRDLGYAWEYVNPDPLAPPGPAWEDVYYTFQIVEVSSGDPIGDPKFSYIPSGDVSDPVPIPDWVTISGDCSNPLIEWEDVLGNLTGPQTGHYRIRVYVLNPDGSFDYKTYLTPPLRSLYPWASLSLEPSKSYAIGIQSRMTATGDPPLASQYVSRSQYYFRYDACYTNDVYYINIDIKPGSDPNSINCHNEKGVITVAILTTDDFDATTVDHTTVTFEGASETHVNKKTGEPRRHEEDVDDDGDIDLVFHFRLGETGLLCDSITGTLTGETFDGLPIEGPDAVRMID